MVFWCLFLAVKSSPRADSVKITSPSCLPSSSHATLEHSTPHRSCLSLRRKDGGCAVFVEGGGKFLEWWYFSPPKSSIRSKGFPFFSPPYPYFWKHPGCWSETCWLFFPTWKGSMETSPLPYNSPNPVGCGYMPSILSRQCDPMGAWGLL